MNSPSEKILITGSGGQLGSQLCRLLGNRSIGIDIADVDLTNPTEVAQVFSQLTPEIVINTAAYTAVDKAQENSDLCFAVNAEAVKTLAENCSAHGCRLVQVSTDYVFGEEPFPRRPHLETDRTSPFGAYAESKRQGEIYSETCSLHTIVRSCGLYGTPGPTATNNFVSTMVKLGRERDHLDVVNDQHCTPTSVAELARAIVYLAETGQNGIFHVTNEGQTTWFEMAQETFRLAEIDCDVYPITTEQYGAPAHRPRYSVLNTDKYRALNGPPMSPWKTALANYLHEILEQ